MKETPKLWEAQDMVRHRGEFFVIKKSEYGSGMLVSGHYKKDPAIEKAKEDDNYVVWHQVEEWDEEKDPGEIEFEKIEG